MNGATVKVYSKSADGGKSLSAHFKVREFACHDGTDTVFVSPQLVTILEKIRTHFSKPVLINSGYRTETWNTKQSGSPKSQHKYGMAADIHIAGVKPKQIAAYARSIMPDWGGVGVYDSFVHVDVRKTRANW